MDGSLARDLHSQVYGHKKAHGLWCLRCNGWLGWQPAMWYLAVAGVPTPCCIDVYTCLLLSGTHQEVPGAAVLAVC